MFINFESPYDSYILNISLLLTLNSLASAAHSRIVVFLLVVIGLFASTRVAVLLIVREWNDLYYLVSIGHFLVFLFHSFESVFYLRHLVRSQTAWEFHCEQNEQVSELEWRLVER